jgi:hypothetical protein
MFGFASLQSPIFVALNGDLGAQRHLASPATPNPSLSLSRKYVVQPPALSSSVEPLQLSSTPLQTSEAEGFT